VATIARLTVPALGEWCLGYEVSGKFLRRVALEPAGETGPPSSLAMPEEIADLLRGDVPRTLDPLPGPLLPLLVERPPSGPVVLAPLRARQRPIGLLVIGVTPPGQDGSSTELIEEFARRAAIALDNAHLYREAQRATETREQVLAAVSHDLKNPMSVIQMSTQLLRRSSSAPPPRQLDTIERSLETMNRLIADLLDMATIQGGNLAVNLATQGVGALLAEAVQLHEPLAQEHGIRMVSGSIPADLAVRADGRRLQQVFGNLIGNAIKFSPRDSTIAVNAVARDGEVVFSVADEGPGITADELSRIFERFWSGQRHGKKSTGLGLFISQGIVRAHGGRIWVESQPGRGSTFHFALPLAQPESAPAHVDEAG
jgi:signal transduction histidine kinase